MYRDAARGARFASKEATFTLLNHREGKPPSSARPRSTQPHFAVIGFPVGIDDRNRDRRALLRELWYRELVVAESEHREYLIETASRGCSRLRPHQL